eukprot:m.24162 g.24162  ORF g.24162 m.24162 type:complete len:1243 (-) comp11159_c0_seq1:281-4009(-)
MASGRFVITPTADQSLSGGDTLVKVCLPEPGSTIALGRDCITKIGSPKFSGKLLSFNVNENMVNVTALGKYVSVNGKALRANESCELRPRDKFRFINTDPVTEYMLEYVDRVAVAPSCTSILGHGLRGGATEAIAVIPDDGTLEVSTSAAYGGHSQKDPIECDENMSDGSVRPKDGANKRKATVADLTTENQSHRSKTTGETDMDLEDHPYGGTAAAAASSSDADDGGSLHNERKVDCAKDAVGDGDFVLFNFSTAPNVIGCRSAYATPVRALQELLVNALDEDVRATATLTAGTILIKNAVGHGRAGLTKAAFEYVADAKKQEDVDTTGMYGFGLKDALTILCFYTLQTPSQEFTYQVSGTNGTFVMVCPDHLEKNVDVKHFPLKQTCVVQQSVSCIDMDYLEKLFREAKHGILHFYKEDRHLEEIFRLSVEGREVKGKKVQKTIEVYVNPNYVPTDNVVFAHNISHQPGHVNHKQRKFAFVYHLKMPKREGAQGRDRLDISSSWSSFLSEMLMKALVYKENLAKFVAAYDRVKCNVDSKMLWITNHGPLVTAMTNLLKIEATTYAEKKKARDELETKIQDANAKTARLQKEATDARKTPNPQEPGPASPSNGDREDDDVDTTGNSALSAMSSWVVAQKRLSTTTNRIKVETTERDECMKKLETIKDQIMTDAIFEKAPMLVAASEVQAVTEAQPNVRVIPVSTKSVEKARRESRSKMAQTLEAQGTFPTWVRPCEAKITRVCQELDWEAPIVNECVEGGVLGQLAEVEVGADGVAVSLTLNVRTDTTADALLECSISAIAARPTACGVLIRNLLRSKDSPPCSPVQSPSVLPGAILLVIDTWGTDKGGIASFNMQLAFDLAKVQPVYVLVTEWTESTDGEASRLKKRGVILVKPYRVGSDWPLPYLPGRESKIAVVIGHAHITGPLAQHICKQPQFKQSKFWIVNHCASGWFDSRKDNYSYTKTIQKDDDLFAVESKANRVWSIGPTIFAYWRTVFQREECKVEHINFQPTLNDFFEAPTDPVQRDSQSAVILIFGRLDDDKAKGVDVGIDVFKAYYRCQVQADQKTPTLIIRGVRNAAEGANLRKTYELDDYSGEAVQIRPYGTPDEIRKDLIGADIVLMPSHVEPYGLVGLEALAMGVPVLSNSGSGFAVNMKDVAGKDLSAPFIVKQVLSGAWINAATAVLKDPKRFQRAEAIREKFTALPKNRHGVVQMSSALHQINSTPLHKAILEEEVETEPLE